MAVVGGGGGGLFGRPLLKVALRLPKSGEPVDTPLLLLRAGASGWIDDVESFNTCLLGVKSSIVFNRSV